MSNQELLQWAPEAEKHYERVRFLGSGAFSSIWIAKARETNSSALPSDAKQVSTCDDVAMKSTDIVKRGDTQSALDYAKNEVTVLQKLEHPHIVKVVQEFSFDSAVFSVALSLASGPTLEQLVDYGGALGIPFAQCVAKQLISALAYLHSRGVIHRDIKPDNVVVTRANLRDKANWCDNCMDSHVQQMLLQWHVILIDFGFAKALRPDDFTEKLGSNPSKIAACEEKTALKMTLNEKLTGVTVTDFDKSVSKKQILNLTALGNKNYVSPEVLKTIRALANENDAQNIRHGSVRPLGKNVSDYGMVADAFSLGALLRYILTGVPPEYKIEEYISRQNNVVAVVARFFQRCTTSLDLNKEQKLQKRKKRFKGTVPKDATNLVHLLTLRDTQRRLTVRHAQCHPWIQLKDENDPEIHAPLAFLVYVNSSVTMSQDDKNTNYGMIEGSQDVSIS